MPWSDPGGNGDKNDNNPWGRRPNAQKPVFDIQKITQELKKLGGILAVAVAAGRRWIASGCACYLFW